MKSLILLAFTVMFAFGSALVKLPYKGVEVQANGKKVLIEREIDPDCSDFGMQPEYFWSGDYAAKEVSKYCKKTFITSKGVVQPIKFNNKIETYGELEVLDFIDKKVKKEPSKYALVDCRPENWYELLTIPSSINIPFDELKPDELFMDEYLAHLKTLGIKKEGNKFSFKKAKTIVIYCNGPWCTQSKRAIKSLINMGYPQEKIKWYRGGMHDWTSMSFTTIKPKVK